MVRPPVELRPDDIVQDVRVEVCPDCGGALEDTGEFVEHVIEDIPPPQVEVRRVRCHRQRCRCCPRRISGRANLDFVALLHRVEFSVRSLSPQGLTIDLAFLSFAHTTPANEEVHSSNLSL